MRDSCHIMAANCPDAIQPNELGDHSYFCYLVVESANVYYAELIKNNAEISAPPQDKPWKMREFPITTIDGHRIMIGEHL